MVAAPPLDLVTIYAGSPGQVAVLQAVLAAEGIPSFVPDATLKTVHPFVTGGSPLACNLQVPTPHVAAARALIRRGEPEVAPPTPPSVRRRWLTITLLLLGPAALALLASLAVR